MEAISNIKVLALRLALSLPAVFSVTTLLTTTTVAENQTEDLATSAESDWMYRVRTGDTLKSIGRQYLTDASQWVTLLHHNKLEDTHFLQPGSLIRIPVKLLKHFPQPATAKAVKGAVQIRKAHTNSYIPALAGSKINIGDELKTLEGSALVGFADGSDLYIEKNSIIIFNSLTHYGKTGMVDTRFRLNRGQISTIVTPRKGKRSRYEVTTPSAVAGVRGTAFRLRANNRFTTAEVTEGTVTVSNSSTRLSLSQGQGARIGATGNILPVSLLPAPEIILPETVNRLPSMISWPPVPNAYFYQVELSEQGQNKLPFFTRQLASPQLSLPPLNNGLYVVTVRATDQNSIQGATARIPFKLEIPINPAELSTPLPGATLEHSQPIFTWQTDANMQSSLEIAQDLDFKNLFSRTPFARLLSGRSDQPLPAGEYYWRVVTFAGADTFAYSTPRLLTIRAKLANTKVIAINYLKNQVKIYWKRVQNAERYRIQLAEDELFQRVSQAEELSTTSATLRLIPGKTYWVRIKAVGNEFYSATYSEAQLIKLPL